MHVLDFLIESQNTEVSVILLKYDWTTDALTAVLEILEKYKGNTCGGVSFRYNYKWVAWTAQIF